MGLLTFLHRIWRFFHPQWTAMTPKQIEEIDRAVAESMAKGSFTTRHRPTPPPLTADQLWTAVPGEYVHTAGGGSGSDKYVPSLSNGTARLYSMTSSRGGVSVSSSRGRDSGYAEQRPPSSRSRKYTPSPQQQHRQQHYWPNQQHYGSYQQQWGYELDSYYYDEQQLRYARPQYPPASYYPEGGYSRAYVRPGSEEDGIVAGEPVNAPF